MGEVFQPDGSGSPPILADPLTIPRLIPVRWPPEVRPRWYRTWQFHAALFLLTILTTLIVGTHIQLNYLRNLPPFDWDISWSYFQTLWRHPGLLVLGMPFSFTLLGILLAHELGHYFTCRYYKIHATYPYFVPAPTLIGTLGAFIRIKSPIFNRRELFDVGFSGPLAGFVLAVPALAWAVLHSKGVAPASTPDTVMLGHPLALILLTKLLRPGLSSAALALNPVGSAAWVGLFATALNLLPVGQLDGGHVLYAVLGDKHRTISRGFFLIMLPLGIFCWLGWMVWGVLLLFLGLRHPRLLDAEQTLGRGRTVLALVAGLIFALTFIPTPFKL